MVFNNTILNPTADGRPILRVIHFVPLDHPIYSRHPFLHAQREDVKRNLGNSI